MKKLLSFLVLTVFCSMVFAQTVTLTFTGQDTNKLYVQLSRVNIENATQNWQHTINYPDTVLELGQVGIENYESGYGFVLHQNNPNPFENTTYSILNTVESGEVVLTLTDMNGRTISMQNFASLQSGIHQFRINVANTGTYLLTALQNGKTSSIKMVNNGKAAENKIEYMGVSAPKIAVSLPVKNITDAITDPFNKGDEMVYTGYATVNGTEYQSQIIRQNQNESEDIVLMFSIVPPVVLPAVVTDSVRRNTGKIAIGGGEVTDNGGDAVTARGVCWSTEQNPTVEGPHTTDGRGEGTFTSFLTDLTLGTTYYVRAYATNSVGTAYGNAVSFTTDTVERLYDGLPCLNLPTVTDHEGNVYNTVQIGSQCWTKENLRTTTSPTTGTYLVNNDTITSKNSSYTGKQAYWYMHDSLTYATKNYGLLYNWNAAVDTFNVNYSNDELSINNDLENTYSVTFTGNRRGICPEGWHLPTDSEWLQLTDYVISIEEYRSKGCECNPENKKYVNCIVKALASTTDWKRIADTEENKEYEEKYGDFLPGKNPADNNATGFTAFPAGYYSGSYGMFADLDNFTLVGKNASFQSATGTDTFFSGEHSLDYDMIYVSHSRLTKDHACSVRCLRD